jgi:outer membrane protein TolC
MRVPASLPMALLLLAAAAPAQPPPVPLTLDDCIQRALAAPSAVSLARRDRTIAADGVTQARAGFLPQASLNLGFTYNSPSYHGANEFSFVALNGVREYIGLAQVFQEIDTSGRLRAECARARAAGDLAAASLALAERDLKRAVAASYYNLLLARHLQNAFQSSLTESESFEQRTRLLAAQGEAAQADVVKAAAQTASLRQALNTATLAASLANQDLASYWTSDVATPLNVADIFEDTLPPPDPPSAEAAPYMRRLEFRLFDASIRSAQADTRIARSALLPRLGAVFQYGLDENRVAWNRRGNATFLSLNITVFDWFKSTSAVRQAKERASQQQESREIAVRAYSRDYQAALARVHTAWQQLDSARQQVDLSTQDLKLSRVRYEGGEGAAVDVVVAQNGLASARAAYYTAIHDYLLARRDLEVATGQ